MVSTASPTSSAAPDYVSEPVTGPYIASDFVATEILGRPTDVSITINVVSAVMMDLYYEYGTAPGTYTWRTESQSATANVPMETLMDGLQPDTRYYYRIRYSGAAGAEHSFMTQRKPGSTFTFEIQGDSHPERVNKEFNTDLYIRTLMSAANDRPDFYMAIGDDFSVDTLKNVNINTVTQLYINQRQWLGLVEAPVFLVNGNHEQAALANLDGTPNNVAVWAANARSTYYPQPAPDSFYTGDNKPVEHIGLLRDYYAFTWGDALFVVIDPYWHSDTVVDNAFGSGHDQPKNRDLWDVTLGVEQYQWFRQTLENSTAKYKFVFAHHVSGTGRGGIEVADSFEWGDAAGLAVHRSSEQVPGISGGWNRTIQQIMEDTHVTIFFQGHDHIFAKQELGGVIYQTLPEPADPNYSQVNADAYHSGVTFPNSGHVRVTVDPNNVKVEYVRSYLEKPDEVAYSYTLAATSQPLVAGQTPQGWPQIPSPEPGNQATQNLPVDVPVHPLDVILGRPTDSSITLSALAYTSQTISISYGTESGNYSSQTDPINLAANVPQTIRISNLNPDTLYFYSVNGFENTFHTARTSGSTFTFTIQADSHLDSNTNPQVYLQTLLNEKADHPDFVMDLGDTFMTEKYKPYTAAEPQYLAQRYYFSQVAQTAPLFLALGNHDGEGAPRGNAGYETSNWAAIMRTRYFPNPEPDDFYTGNTTPISSVGNLLDYYAWTWGDALFIVLDPYWFTPPINGTTDQWNQTLGETQYGWLKTTLENSHSTWKFVFIHQLIGGTDQNGRGGVSVAGLYEWGGNNADGTYGFDTHRPGWDMPIHQLLVTNHVTAVFHGHDHLFAKEELDGIIYQDVPQPGSARANDTSKAVEYGYLTGEVIGSPGYIRVTVAPSEVTVDYVRTYLPENEQPGQVNGQVDYSYTVK